jgi:hypothetical protein
MICNAEDTDYDVNGPTGTTVITLYYAAQSVATLDQDLADTRNALAAANGVVSDIEVVDYGTTDVDGEFFIAYTHNLVGPLTTIQNWYYALSDKTKNISQTYVTPAVETVEDIVTSWWSALTTGMKAAVILSIVVLVIMLYREIHETVRGGFHK